MDFKIPAHAQNVVLNGEDLKFFYYEIGLDHFQGIPSVDDWDAVIGRFKGQLEIEVCNASQIASEPSPNKIQFTVSNSKKHDDGSRAAAFFRHLRNAFSHYRIVREGENFAMTDAENGKTTMRGLVNAELLKEFCFCFFDTREEIQNELENTSSSTL